MSLRTLNNLSVNDQLFFKRYYTRCTISFRLRRGEQETLVKSKVNTELRGGNVYNSCTLEMVNDKLYNELNLN